MFIQELVDQITVNDHAMITTDFVLRWRKNQNKSCICRMKKTILWRRSSGCAAIRTTRRWPFRRCLRKPLQDSCHDLSTSSPMMTSLTGWNQVTVCRLSGSTVACLRNRVASPLGPSGVCVYLNLWSVWKVMSSDQPLDSLQNNHVG